MDTVSDLIHYYVFVYPMPMLQLLTDYWLTYSCGDAVSVLCWPVRQLAKCHTKTCLFS